MAAREKITFDKTEISVYDDSGKRPVILNLTYERIMSIQFDHGQMPFMGIFKKPSDRIMFQVRGLENPVILYKAREGDKFDGYIEGLRKFAKDNRITLHDYLANPEQQK